MAETNQGKGVLGAIDGFEELFSSAGGGACRIGSGGARHEVKGGHRK